MVVRCRVCGTPYPGVSVAGLCCLGYCASSTNRKTSLLWNHHLAEVTTDRGWYFLEPKAHQQKHVLGVSFYTWGGSIHSWVCSERAADREAAPAWKGAAPRSEGARITTAPRWRDCASQRSGGAWRTWRARRLPASTQTPTGTRVATEDGRPAPRVGRPPGLVP